MQYDLGFVQFLLDLHDAIHLFWFLVFGQVVFSEFWERQRWCRVRVFLLFMQSSEVFDDFGKELMCRQSRVISGANDYASNAV